MEAKAIKLGSGDRLPAYRNYCCARFDLNFIETLTRRNSGDDNTFDKKKGGGGG